MATAQCTPAVAHDGRLSSRHAPRFETSYFLFRHLGRPIGRLCRPSLEIVLSLGISAADLRSSSAPEIYLSVATAARDDCSSSLLRTPYARLSGIFARGLDMNLLRPHLVGASSSGSSRHSSIRLSPSYARRHFSSFRRAGRRLVPLQWIGPQSSRERRPRILRAKTILCLGQCQSQDHEDYELPQAHKQNSTSADESTENQCQ